MAYTFEEAFFDADHFLNQTANFSTDKKTERREIKKLKLRIISTQRLLGIYQANKDALDQSQRMLANAKDENKQICLDYNKALEKCERLDKECQALRDKTKDLEERAKTLDNCQAAAQSYAKQLEALLKEREISLDAIKAGRKADKSNLKYLEKKISNIQKDQDELLENLQNIANIVLNEKKLNRKGKQFLLKYRNPDVTEGRDSEDDDIVRDSDAQINNYMVNASKEKRQHNSLKSTVHENEHDSDIDTGRGSSLEDCDSDKCFNSPDYFITDSPPNIDAFNNKSKKTQNAEMATSPVIFEMQKLDNETYKAEVDKYVVLTETTDKATSPIMFDMQTLDDESYKSGVDKYVALNETTDMATSPVMFDMQTFDDESYKSGVDEYVVLTETTDKATSPVMFDMQTLDDESYKSGVDKYVALNGTTDMATSPVMFDMQTLDDESYKSGVGKYVVLNETTDMATSPVMFELEKLFLHDDVSSSHKSGIDKIDKSTSPVKLLPKTVSVGVVTSPVKVTREIITFEKYIECSENDSEFLPADRSTGEVHDQSDNNKIDLFVSEKECLETNNSINLNSYDSTSSEIEEILDDMRISYDLVTPIPPSPKKSIAAPPGYLASELNGIHPVFIALLDHLFQEVNTLKSYVLKNNLSRGIDDDKNGQVEYHIQSILELLSNGASGERNSLNSVIEKALQSYKRNNFYVADDNQSKCHFSDNNENVSVSPIRTPDPQPENNNNLSSVVTESSSKTYDRIQYERDVGLSLETIRSQNMKNDIVKNHTSQEIIQDSANNLLENGEKIQYENEVSSSLDTRPQNTKNDIVKNSHSSQEIIQDPANNVLGNGKRISKAKKLTRLQKLREKLIPKSKIKKADPPTPTKRLRQLVTSKCNTNMVASKNQFAFEKAVKIIAELKSNQNTDLMCIIKPHAIKRNNRNNNNPTQINDSEAAFKEIESQKSTESGAERNNLLNTVESSQRNDAEAISRKSNRHSLTEVDANKNNNDSKTTFEKTDLQHSKKHVFDRRNVNSNNGLDIVKTVEKNIYETPSDDCVLADVKKTILDKKFIPLVRCEKLPDFEIKTLSVRGRSISSSVIDNDNVTTKTDIPTNEAKPVKRLSIEKTEIQTTRLLRSSTTRSSIENDNSLDAENDKSNRSSRSLSVMNQVLEQNCLNKSNRCALVSYDDMDRFGDEPSPNKVTRKTDIPQNKAKPVKRSSIDKTDTQITRVLRSSTLRNSTENDNPHDPVNHENIENCQSPIATNKGLNRRISKESNTCALVSYEDMDIFNDEPSPKKKSKCENEAGNIILSPQNSILCKMIEKHSLSAMKHAPKKISETVVTAVCIKIEDEIAHIIELPSYEARPAMDKLVEDLQKWRLKEFILGLTQYLSNPTRKDELFKKITTPPAPDMTKQEQILLYLITRLNICWPDIVNCILNQIEYTLFKLNQSPDFGVIESMSHFYAVLCRYIKAKSRLRLFVLDAMYCLQFKSIPLVKQCIEVWWHILPLAHMGIAKSPIVTCMVYVLHYYKCDDRYNRVQDIRNLLNKKYFYQITEWNEPKMLEMFKNAITELKDNPIDRKMLRLSFIILAKRHGPKWCQNKLIKNMLQPIITKEKVPERIRAFCVSMLGPLMKPYPMDMKVNSEIVINQLIDMLGHNPSVEMQEAIFTSLISLSKYNQNHVIQALLAWQPKQVSLDMELLLRDYVKEKPLRVWQGILSKIPLVQ